MSGCGVPVGLHGGSGTGVGCGQDHAGQADVLANADSQGIGAGKLPLGPYALDKMHPDGLVVEIALEIEDVGLNGQRVLPEGGIPADVGHPGPDDAVDLHPDGIDAGHGNQFVAGRHVGRGETELAPAFLAVGHGAAHLVVAPEQGAHVPDLAGLDHVPDAGGGNDGPVDDDRFQALHGKAVLLTQGRQEFEIALAPLAEGIVVADDQMLEVQSADQDVAHEGSGLLGGQFPGEGQDHGHLDAAYGEAFELLVEHGDGRRRGMAGEHIAGVGIEGQGHGGQRGGGGPVAHALQQLGVPHVHAVEIANGQADAGKDVLEVLDAGNDDHGLCPRAIVASAARPGGPVAIAKAVREQPGQCPGLFF